MLLASSSGCPDPDISFSSSNNISHRVHREHREMKPKVKTNSWAFGLLILGIWFKFHLDDLCVLCGERVYPRIAFRSDSGVVIGLILKVFTSVASIFGETNAGRLGPKRIFLIPR